MDKLEHKGTKGEWKQRQFFKEPILVQDKERGCEWFYNNIEIVDNDGRIISEVKYITDTENMGWGNNETIGKWKANAKLIAAAPDMFDALLRMKKSIEEQNLQHYFGHSIQYINEAIEKALK